MRIGVLSFQGSVEEHLKALDRLHVSGVPIKTEGSLQEIDGLILPGGESTTFLKLLHSSKLFKPLSDRIKNGLPIMATCAGLILLAEKIANVRQESFSSLPITIERNGYGPQYFSFCEEVVMKGLPDPFRAVFIRAPVITYCNPAVETVSKDHEGNPIFIKYNKILGLTFHPELTDDDRIHEIFINLIDHK